MKVLYYLKAYWILVIAFLLLYAYTINFNFLYSILGISMYVPFYNLLKKYKKRAMLSNSMNIPLNYRKGRSSDELIRQIGYTILDREKKVSDKFTLSVYSYKNSMPIMHVKSKQYFPKIDCNANYRNFGIVIVLLENKNKDSLINWISKNMPYFKYYYDMDKSSIVISLISDYDYHKFNSPLIAEVLYGYLELDDRFNIHVKYDNTAVACV